MSGEYEPIRSGTKATFRFRCRWKAYGSMSWAAQLTGRSPDGRRVDRSFQTDARALARPDDGAAGVASCEAPDESRDEPGRDDDVRHSDPEREQEVDERDPDRYVDRGGEAVPTEDEEITSARHELGRPAPQSSQSHVFWPRRTRRPQARQ